MNTVAWALSIVVVCVLVTAVLVVVFSTDSPNSTLIQWNHLERRRSEQAELLQLQQLSPAEQLRHLWTHALPPPDPAPANQTTAAAAFQRWGYTDLTHGVVVTADGPVLTRQAQQLILELRRAGCRWPIQLWHRRDQIDTATLRTLATDHHVLSRCFEVEAPHWPCENRFGWKILALYLCPFGTALYLDADNHVLADPTSLVDWPPFRDTGALFWPDVHRLDTTAPCFDGFSAAQRARLPMYQQNSAQLLLRLTATHRHHLWLIYRLLENKLEGLFPTPYNYGDKDMFYATWIALDQPFAWASTQPALEIRDEQQRPVAVAQVDPRQPPALLWVQDTVPAPVTYATLCPLETPPVPLPVPFLPFS